MVKRKLNKKKLILFIITVILVLFSISIGLFFFSLRSIDNNTDLIDYKVEKGTSVYEVLDDLEKKEYIRNALFLKIYSKTINNLSINAGVYKISTSMSSIEILKTLIESETFADSISITLKEGQTIEDLATLVEDNTNILKDTFLTEINNKEMLNSLINDYWFLTNDILSDDIYYALEGYMYPNTYEIYKETTTKDITIKFLDELENKLEDLKDDVEFSRYSIHEIMTLASIVEIEGSNGTDRKGIAGVFVNRINNNYSLGSDVTTYYANHIKLYERDLIQNELDDCTSKYNTRCSSLIGLPIGPISNPSYESIDATLNYTKSDYFYFVSDKNKQTYFSKTYSEHNKTINKLKNEGMWYEY